MKLAFAKVWRLFTPWPMRTCAGLDTGFPIADRVEVGGSLAADRYYVLAFGKAMVTDGYGFGHFKF